MEDSDNRLARLVLLTELVIARKQPTMTPQERVAVALVLNKMRWLRYHGYTVPAALEFAGEGYAAVIVRAWRIVRQAP